jgi:DNA polymerase I-like protein with 3'-5' exonuclease and polymerase domains
MKLYGIDIETHDPHLTDKGASWVYGEGEIIITGLYNKQAGKKSALPGNGGQTVKKLLLDPEVTLAGANIVYDIGWLCYEHKLSAKEIKCNLVDVSIAEQCIDEYQPFSLDALAWKYLGEKKGTGKLPAIAAAKGMRGDFRKHLKALWDTGYKPEIMEYVISDADQPVRVWEKQKQILTEKAAKGYEDFSGSMEAVITNFKLIKIVLDMKQRGVRIDMKKREKNYELLARIQKRLQDEFEAQYGKANFNSPKQLAELFDRERVPYRCKIRIKGYEGELFSGNELWEQRKNLKETFNGARVEKGQLVIYTPKQYSGRTNDDLRRLGYVTTCNPSIDKKALGVAKKSHDVAKKITDLKQVTSIIDKFMGSKFDRFIVKHGPDDYRIHADFNIVGARQTGRLSSANPNLQQVPSKTALFKGTPDEIKLYTLCREIIIPDEGMLMGKMDYSGQENRLMAHYAVGEGADEIRRKYNENPELDFHKYIGEISGLYDD